MTGDGRTADTMKGNEKERAVEGVEGASGRPEGNALTQWPL